MLNFFIFNGESSADFGAYIGGQGTYNTPQRDVTVQSIPGRNGDLIFDNGRFLNVSLTYPLVVMDDFARKVSEINAWLCAGTGYGRLEDTYHPDEFRMARLSAPITYETTMLNKAGKTKVTFDCMPQRFLKSGEEWVTVTGKKTLQNPTRFESQPLIRAYCNGNGTVKVNDQIIQLSGISEYVDIDSFSKNCYKGTENMNNKVSLSHFPEFGKVVNLEFTGSVTRLEVQGRWWTV